MNIRHSQAAPSAKAGFRRKRLVPESGSMEAPDVWLRRSVIHMETSAFRHMSCVTVGVHTCTARSIILARQYAIQGGHRSTRRRRWSGRSSAGQIGADWSRRAPLARAPRGPTLPHLGHASPRGLILRQSRMAGRRAASRCATLCSGVTLACALSPNTAMSRNAGSSTPQQPGRLPLLRRSER